MSFVQVPPAPGSSGQNIESVQITSSQHRQVFVLGDPVTAAGVLPITTSGGALVTISNPTTAITVSNPTTAVNVLTSGPLQVLTSGPLNVLTSGPLTISGTLTVLSASSGVVQTLTTGAYPVLTSGPLQVLTSGPTTISGTVSILSASSGLVQTLTSGAMVLSSAGITQAIVTGSSGVGAIVTSSGALLVSGTPGSVSTAVNLLTSGNVIAPVTSSYGLMVEFHGVRSFNGASTVGVPLLITVSTLPARIHQIIVGASGTAAVHTLNVYNTATCAVITARSTSMSFNIGNPTGGQGTMFDSPLGVISSVGIQMAVALTQTSAVVSSAATTLAFNIVVLYST